MVIASLIYIAGALTEFFAHSYGVLLLGRIIVGVGIGYFSSTVPLYIAELAPTSIRGKLVTANQLNVCIGAFPYPEHTPTSSLKPRAPPPPPFSVLSSPITHHPTYCRVLHTIALTQGSCWAT